MFLDQDFEFIGVSTPSGVADQPISNSETFLGAKNRANTIFGKFKDADFHVGIEGGIEQFENEMEAFAWIFILSKDKCGKREQELFFFPMK